VLCINNYSEVLNFKIGVTADGMFTLGKMTAEMNSMEELIELLKSTPFQGSKGTVSGLYHGFCHRP
jgi:hypothetical protein